MKTKTQLVIVALAVALSSSVCSATIKASLPEFKSKADIQITGKTKNQSSTLLVRDGFYTGKPYEAAREGYLFKYRGYDPKLSRWTSIDPSGFPDGSNNLRYASCPTNGVDPFGLFDYREFLTGSGLLVTGVAITGAGIAAMETAAGAFILNPLAGATDFGLAVAALASGPLAVTAGATHIVGGFLDTRVWIPSSYAGVIAYTVASAAGTNRSFAESLSNIASTIELAGLPGSTSLIAIAAGLSSSADNLSGLRSLIPAEQDGQPGYE